MKLTPRTHSIAVLAVCVLAFASGALARQPSSIYGRDVNQVYVRDSAIAVEKFALAERMERLLEWSKAADVYQEVLTTYSDRVVPSKTDKENRIVQYSSVVSAVQERLSRWPAEGIAAYRARYEVEAQALLDSAKSGAAGVDLSTLHRVFSTYFLTDAARIAGIRMTDVQLESGEFAAAAWTAQRLLDLYPNLNADRPMLLYRAALAYHMGGDDAQATARLADLQRDSPEALGKIRGQDVRLVEALQSDLAAPRPILHASAGDSWPMAFGSADRNRVPRAVTSVGARLFTVELNRPEALIGRGAVTEAQPQNDLDRQAGYMTGVYPSIDQGELFFQDNMSVYAFGLESGLPLPGWAQSYPTDSSGRYTIRNAAPTPRGHVLTVSVTDDSVLAVMGHTDLRMISMTGTVNMHDTRLVSLDRKTGRERWVARPQAIAQTAPEALRGAIRQMDLSGSPLVVGDNVYVMLRGGKGLQFEDCYVMCLDTDTGEYKWATYVASANAPGPMEDFGMTAPQGTSHLAYASGRVFCLTNLGAVAALGAYDGTIAWLNVYPREQAEPRGNRRWQNFAPQPVRKPWTFNPVIVSEGKVFVLPTDGQFLHVYDAGNGAENQRVGTAVSAAKLSGAAARGGAETMIKEQLNQLLGVIEGKVYAASDRGLICFDWKKFDASKPAASIRWTKQLSAPTTATLQGKQLKGDTSPMRGRPFLSAHRLFIPTAWNLQPLDSATGVADNAFPADGWGAEDVPGNVLATGEHLIVAGPTRVVVYTDLSLALRRLDAAVAAAPSDPEPRLRYAEVMFVSRKLDVAMDKLDEAIELMGGRAALASGPLRDRLFADLVAFAQKLIKDPGKGARAKEIAELYERAADAAQSPLQHVNLRLARAEHARLIADPAAELRLYQEILAQPAWRSIMVARADAAGTRPAGLVADDAVEKLIARPDGKALYASVEQHATTALEAARTLNDPAKLMEVARAFPNSSAARQGALLAADALETAGNPREAVQALRQIYFRDPDAPDRAKIIESMARNYLAMPNHLDVAIARLSQGAKLPGNPKLARPMKLPDGQVLKDITFAQALSAVAKLQSKAASIALPDLHLPAASTEGPARPAFKPADQVPVIDGVIALCVPLRGFERADRVVVYAPATGVSVYSPGGDQPRFSTNVLEEGPRGIAWLGGNLLAWTTTKIAMLDGESGFPAWELPLSTLPAADHDAPEVAVANEVGADAALAAGIAEAGVDIVAGRNGRLMLQGNGRLMINGRVMRAEGQQFVVRNGQLRVVRRNNRFPGMRQAEAIEADPDAAAAKGAEVITSVSPLSDRVMIGTSAGRVAAVDLVEGKVIWQARPVASPVDKLLANDDFVVARYADITAAQLVAMESSQGQIVFRRRFVSVNGAPTPLVNAALSSDGTLVWVQPDRIVAKDLFEPGDNLRFGEGADTGARTFASAAGVDQFVIADGRIFAVSDRGTQVRVLSLENGKYLFRAGGGPMLLATGTDANADGDPSALPQIRVVGSSVYVESKRPAVFTAWGLDPPGKWDYRVEGSLRESLVTRDSVVVVTESPDAKRKQRNVELRIHSREPNAKGTESGLLVQYTKIVEPAGITTWQAVEGGIYYLAGDHKLHFLAGAGK